MKSILQLTRINSAFPFVGRAAERQMVDSLNFTIANLAASHIRQTKLGTQAEEDTHVDLDPLIARYGNTLDKRNEIDEAARGAQHEAAMREEQGGVPHIDTLKLAGQLKLVRDYLAEDVAEYAVRRKNPMDPKGGTYVDPFTICRTLEESLVRQLTQQPRINKAQLEAMAKELGLPYDDLERVQKRGQEAGLRFLKENQEEMRALLNELGVRNEVTGEIYSTADAEEVEQSLPTIHRARLFVSADRGLWYERDNTIRMLMRGHPDAAGNLKLVNSAREEIHALFDVFMKDGNHRADIDEAVRGGATWPVLLALPPKQSELIAEAHRKTG